jgi:hypothetical protein
MQHLQGIAAERVDATAMSRCAVGCGGRACVSVGACVRGCAASPCELQVEGRELRVEQ